MAALQRRRLIFSWRKLMWLTAPGLEAAGWYGQAGFELREGIWASLCLTPLPPLPEGAVYCCGRLKMSARVAKRGNDNAVKISENEGKRRR